MGLVPSAVLEYLISRLQQNIHFFNCLNEPIINHVCLQLDYKWKSSEYKGRTDCKKRNITESYLSVNLHLPLVSGYV